MTEFLWFVAGAVSSFVINLITEALFPSIRRRIRLFLLRGRAKRHPIIGFSPTKIAVGGMTINCPVLASGEFTQGRIRCTYKHKPHPLPAELKRMKDELTRDKEKKKAKGESTLFNSPMYKLTAFDVGYREVVNGEEVPILRLSFCPTDYFTSLVTDFNSGNPTRDRYAQIVDITHSPVPEFATIVGVNIGLVTSDGYYIAGERGGRVAIGAYQLTCSVNENMLRPTDAGKDGTPDPFRTAVRGAREELGIELEPNQITFTHFTVELELCEYSLYGWAHIRQTRKEVEQLRSIYAKDSWESKRLIFVPCTPHEIARFVIENRGRWQTFGLVPIVMSLFSLGYSKTEINRAFEQAQTN